MAKEELHEDGYPVYKLGVCFNCAQCGVRITPGSPHCYCSLNDPDYEPVFGESYFGW